MFALRYIFLLPLLLSLSRIRTYWYVCVCSSNFYYLYLGKRRCVQSTGSSFIFVVCHFHAIFFWLANKRRKKCKKNHYYIQKRNIAGWTHTAYDMGFFQMFFIMTFISFTLQVIDCYISFKY